jgi:hypothetical protein
MSADSTFDRIIGHRTLLDLEIDDYRKTIAVIIDENAQNIVIPHCNHCSKQA